MITIMKNPLKNITRITNEEAVTGGTIAEDDESLRERIFGTYEKDPERLAPVGVYDYLVTAPTPVLINISLDLKIDKNFTLQEVEENIKNSLYKHYVILANERTLEDYEEIVLIELRYVAVSSAILNAKGVNDFKHLRINGSLNNVIFAEDEFPVTGNIEARLYE